MPKAVTIITGRHRRLSDAISNLETLGVVDESTIVIEELGEIEINEQTVQVPATKVTAEVTPSPNNNKEKTG